MTAAKRTPRQPLGPRPDREEIANAYHDLANRIGAASEALIPVFVAAVTEDILRRLADSHSHCKMAGCTRCKLLRHGLAYVYALEIMAGP
jgi:hypothetical protein